MVVSGLPNITPIFIRIWLMKITQQLDLEITAGQFPQGLGHQACLKSHVGIPHVPFNLSLGDQRGNRIDDQDVYCPAPDEHSRSCKGLLSCVGLGDQEIIGLHP